jgi:GST-like protein
MIELHGERTGNCLRVAIALEAVGLPYTVKLVDLRSGEQRGPDHLALNPAGKVPAIVDRVPGEEPFVLSQSNAIIMYLDQKVPGILFPVALRPRAIAIERFFHFVTDVIGPEMAQYRIRDQESRQALIRLAIEIVVDAERYLEGFPFMGGDSLSAADDAAAVFILSYQRHVDWDAAPKLADWFQRVVGRREFERGLTAFD